MLITCCRLRWWCDWAAACPTLAPLCSFWADWDELQTPQRHRSPPPDTWRHLCSPKPQVEIKRMFCGFQSWFRSWVINQAGFSSSAIESMSELHLTLLQTYYLNFLIPESVNCTDRTDVLGVVFLCHTWELNDFFMDGVGSFNTTTGVVNRDASFSAETGVYKRKDPSITWVLMKDPQGVICATVMTVMERKIIDIGINV